MKGKKHTKETKKKISNKLKLKPTKYWLGKKRSINTIKKMIETKKRMYKEGKIICWNKGLTKETNEKINRMSENKDRKEKISKTMKGREFTEEHKKNMSLGRKGMKFTEEHKKNIGLSRIYKSGKNHPNWNGGSSFEPYGIEFNKKLKEKIRKKYNYRCQQCFRHQKELYNKYGKKYSLSIHHIDYNKKNNLINNLIPLCANCHQQTNFKRGDWINYFQNKQKDSSYGFCKGATQ